jgi:hypothetical protein
LVPDSSCRCGSKQISKLPDRFAQAVGGEEANYEQPLAALAEHVLRPGVGCALQKRWTYSGSILCALPALLFIPLLPVCVADPCELLVHVRLDRFGSRCVTIRARQFAQIVRRVSTLGAWQQRFRGLILVTLGAGFVAGAGGRRQMTDKAKTVLGNTLAGQYLEA